MLSPGLIVCLALFACLSDALQIDVQGVLGHHPAVGRRSDWGGAPHSLHKRADDVTIVSYYTNIRLAASHSKSWLTLGGHSDLWVAGNVTRANSTGHTGGVNYVLDVVNGNIKTAQLQFAGFTIPNQTFLEVAPNNQSNGRGILGLGPNVASKNYQELRSDSAAGVMDRIFLQNQSLPTFVTFLLSRYGSTDPTSTFAGKFTVGEVAKGYEDIINEPRLPVTDVPLDQRGNQHFQILLDADGIYGPDGKVIPITTMAKETTDKKQATAIIDTGFTFPQVPAAVAKAIYGRIPGAEIMDIPTLGDIWILPCDREVNITFSLGGKKFPIHPLDATMSPLFLGQGPLKNSKGENSCLGSFQPVSFDLGADPLYDIILGMTFIRNTYTLMAYGDFILGSTVRNDPYIQCLSVTDPAKAHREFVDTRLGGVDTTGTQTLTAVTAGSSRNTSPYIVAAVVVGIILVALAGFLLYRCRRSRRSTKRRSPPSTPILQPSPTPSNPPSYHNPSPAVDVRQV
ncbi:aspartic peptidase domain-containing protein [Infundibulicybe gibba]|nr:aspartic peptidase domain-containing protein [Infundibulicybe gibba]